MTYTGRLPGETGAEERSGKGQNHGSGTSAISKVITRCDLSVCQYLVRIIGLFQGRIIDKLEQDMLETEYATGGEVKHEVCMSLHLDLLSNLSTVLDLHDWWNPFFRR